MRHVVVMVTSSYPRFPGDVVGTFMEPIARGVAARGHEVHVVAPWHPSVVRAPQEDGIHFHYYRYVPPGLPHTFGYAGALKADVTFRASAIAAAPLAVAAGIRAARRVSRQAGATILHGHWVVPGGFMARLAAGSAVPLVVSLHGSDVYVAEKHALAGRAARGVFTAAAWVTACSADLRDRAIAIGAAPARTEVLPYGVDTSRFAPDPQARRALRGRFGLADEAPIVFTAGRLVRKKGFEYLIDALPRVLATHAGAHLVIAGGGDLESDLRARAAQAGVGAIVHFLGSVAQSEMPALLAAADVIAVPSIRDDAGNVDGLPNVVMESLSSATPMVATTAGGIGAVVDDGRTGFLVAERDAEALAGAVTRLLGDPALRARVGDAARQEVCLRYTWERFAARLEAIFDLAVGRRGAGTTTRGTDR
jgi:glycosyltransferase involved in cell wall biosynthesis